MMGTLRSAAKVVVYAVALTWLFLFAYVVTTASQAQAADATPQLEQRRDEPQTSVRSVEKTVMCPSCDTTLDRSNSPAAERMRVWVEEAVAAGWTDDEIRDGLVAEYGGDESILATPRAHGIGLLVYLVPAGIVALAALVGAFLIVRWRRAARRASAS